MMKNSAGSENRLTTLIDEVRRGLISVDEANVRRVLNERFIIVEKLPRQVRLALNKAVKDGILAHFKKDGDKPEADYHPKFDFLVNAERNRIANYKNQTRIEFAKTIFVANLEHDLNQLDKE